MATTALWMVIGLVVGLVAAGGVAIVLQRRAAVHAAKLLADAQQQNEQQRVTLVELVRREFAALSRDALSANTDDFLKLAKNSFEQQNAQAQQTLDAKSAQVQQVLDAKTVQSDQALEAKKELIDAHLREMSAKLMTLNGLLQSIDKQRAESHAALKSELERASLATNRLHDTTAQLREALAHPQRRGQWGERMAEDVLRLAGFVRGVNYEKQQTLNDGNRPDFTFFLPGGHKVHMDVKFPLANYLKMLDATDDAGRNGFRTAFLKDVRERIKGVTTREYIDPAAGTVDYVLVFIPNEQIYGFIHECDGTLLDEAIQSRVVPCSPLSLYAVLAVMRQAMENFRLERSSRQILELLGEFRKQWGKYCETMKGMGDRLEAAMKEYNELTGVRTRMLDKQMDKVEALREAVAEVAPAELPG